MRAFEDRYETPKWRTFWLVIGFTILVAVGVVTVLLPEIEDEQGAGQNAEIEGDARPPVDESAKN